MPRGNRPCKVDGNHAVIVKALRDGGWFVIDTHALGRVLDTIVISKTDTSRALMGEIKMPGEKLTKAEAEFVASYPGRWRIFRSEEEAIEIMKEFDAEVME